MKKVKVCHITTVHEWDDLRILPKQCMSLAKSGYEVHLVANGKEDSFEYETHIHNINFTGGRIKRILFGTQKALKKALEVKADIYELHDPELLLIARKLKASGAKVIFDSHENVPADILDKEWIPSKLVRKIISGIYDKFESNVTNQIDGVISVLEPITDKFKNPVRETIKNFPILNSVYKHKDNWTEDKAYLIYTGGLSKIRGLKQMIDALEYVEHDVTLHLFGAWETEEYHRQCQASKGWGKVKFHGMVSNDEVYKALSGAHLGMVNFLKVPNHILAHPNKAFEFMAAGIPMIMSDIEFWKDEFSDTAYFVDPEKPKEIASKINEVLGKREEMKARGELGVKLTHEKFSWDSQGKKLVKFYQKIMEN